MEPRAEKSRGVDHPGPTYSRFEGGMTPGAPECHQNLQVDLKPNPNKPKRMKKYIVHPRAEKSTGVDPPSRCFGGKEGGRPPEHRNPDICGGMNMESNFVLHIV